MRTTLAIDDDVLAAARSLAERQKRSLGEVVSDLARKALMSAPAPPKTRNGISLLPGRGVVVTSEVVAVLADELP